MQFSKSHAILFNTFKVELTWKAC